MAIRNDPFFSITTNEDIDDSRGERQKPGRDAVRLSLASQMIDASREDLERKKRDRKITELETLEDHIRGQFKKKLHSTLEEFVPNGRNLVQKSGSFPNYSFKRDRGLALTAFAVNEKSGLIYSANSSGKIMVLNLETNVRKLFAKVSKRSILTLALSSDGKLLAAAGASGKIYIFDAETGKMNGAMKGHKGAVHALRFRIGTHELFSGGKDGILKIWAVDSLSFSEELFGHFDAILSLDILEDELAVSSGDDETARFWKIADESHFVFTEVHKLGVDVVRMLSNRYFVSGGQDGALTLWASNRKKPMAHVSEAHKGWVSALAVVPMKNLIVSGGTDGKVIFWRAEPTEKRIVRIQEMDLRKVAGFFGVVSDLYVTAELKVFGIYTYEHRLGAWKQQGREKKKNGIFMFDILEEL